MLLNFWVMKFSYSLTFPPRASSLRSLPSPFPPKLLGSLGMKRVFYKVHRFLFSFFSELTWPYSHLTASANPCYPGSPPELPKAALHSRSTFQAVILSSLAARFHIRKTATSCLTSQDNWYCLHIHLSPAHQLLHAPKANITLVAGCTDSTQSLPSCLLQEPHFNPLVPVPQVICAVLTSSGSITISQPTRPQQAFLFLSFSLFLFTVTFYLRIFSPVLLVCCLCNCEVFFVPQPFQILTFL